MNKPSLSLASGQSHQAKKPPEKWEFLARALRDVRPRNDIMEVQWLRDVLAVGNALRAFYNFSIEDFTREALKEGK
jgi:hypothetical protein